MDLNPTLTRPRLTAVAALLLVVGLAACGGDDAADTPDDGGAAVTTTTAAPSGAGGSTVQAADFSLTNLTVGPGAEFTLENQGDATHTATADDGSFDSGRVDGGQQSAAMVAPTEPGQYPYHCEIHTSMTGTLTVE